MIRMLSRHRYTSIVFRALAFALVLALSGGANLLVAYAAEVAPIEVVAGVDNGVVIVEQGRTATFSVKIAASGLIDPRITSTAPAYAQVTNYWSVQSYGVLPMSAGAAVPFYVNTASASGKEITWKSFPAPYTQEAIVYAPQATPVGDYVARIPVDTTNPFTILDPALRLNDSVADYVTFRVVASDRVAPTTVASIAGPAGTNGWYLGDSTVNLTATDNAGGTGVQRSEISTDGATWYTGTSAAVAGEGSHTIYYRSADKAGNLEATKSVIVKLDCTDPAVEVAGITDAGSYACANISCSGGDSASGSGLANVAALLDGEAVANSCSITSEGDHVLTVTATDAAGRSASRSLSFSVDRSAPSISITPENGAVSRSAFTFDFAVDDANGIATVDSSHPGGTVFDTEGAYTVSVNAVDGLGNAGSKSSSFVIDRTAPDTVINLTGTQGNPGWFLSDVQVNLNATDPISAGTNSGVAASYYRIDGGSFETYSGPFMVSGSGSHVIDCYSTDAAGNTEDVVSTMVAIDTVDPSIDVQVDGPVASVASGWYNGPAYATASGADAESGVAFFEYSLDGSDFIAATGPVEVGEGVHELRMRAVDAAGRTSAVWSREIKVDATVPSTSALVQGASGANGWHTSAATVTLSSHDEGSGIGEISYSTDAGATWQTYDGGIAVAEAGVHSVLFKATDRAGNAEPSKAKSVSVDLDDPLVSIQGVAEGERVQQAAILVEASDPMPGSDVAQVTATLDGEPFDSATVVDAPGLHTVVATAEDHAGRTSTTSLSFVVDVTAPLITLTSVADGASYPSHVVFDYAVTDDDPGTVAMSDPAKDTVIDVEGAHVASVMAWDTAGNQAACSAAFKIDKTSPVTEADVQGSAGRGGWYLSALSINLNATDPLVGFVPAASGVAATYYRVDGGAWSTGAHVGIEQQGTHVLEYYSTDAVGNAEDIKSLSLKIDLTDPVIDLSSPTAHTMLYNQPVTAAFAATDDQSGMTQTIGTLNGVTTVNSGTTFNCTQAGANVLRVTATNQAGRTSVVDWAFDVHFVPGDFQPPNDPTKPITGNNVGLTFWVMGYNNAYTGNATAHVQVTYNGTKYQDGYAIVAIKNGIPEYRFWAQTQKGWTGTFHVHIELNDGFTTFDRDYSVRR